MKKLLLLAVAAMAVLSSCTKDEPVVAALSDSDDSFIATIESNGVTRTYLNSDSKIMWNTYDTISINGKKYVADPKDFDDSQAEFSKVAEAAEASGSSPAYEAYYPTSIYNEGSPTLPATQIYVYDVRHNRQLPKNLPMYAGSDDHTLCFKNICGVLAITIGNDDISTLQSIRVSSSNKAMRGAFDIVGDKAVLKSPDVPGNMVTLSMTASAPDGTIFYIAIPPQTYQDLKIELSSDGVTYSASMVTKHGVDIVVERNNIYDIDFAANTLTLNKGQIFVDRNSSTQLTATAQNVTWTSSDTNVATVTADGVVTPVSSNFAGGTAVITATTADDKTADCVVTVYGVSGTAARTGSVNVDFVQLWDNGVKFATFNVGSTAATYTSATGNGSTWGTAPYTNEFCGGHYQWGGINDGASEYEQYTGESKLPASYDTATRLWGNSWRMPGQADFEMLLAGVTNLNITSKIVGTYCDWEWMDGSTKQYVADCTLKGWKVTGHGTYASHSIFFPAAYTTTTGSKGCYWSTEPDGGNAKALFFHTTDLNPQMSLAGGYGRMFCQSVRAIVSRYAVSVNVSTGGGTVTVDQNRLDEGETATLTITPANGYMLTSISAADGNSHSVALMGSDLTRTFTMPGSDVTVTATFEPIVAVVNQVNYSTLQGAFNAAASATEDVEIDIVRDIVFNPENKIITTFSSSTSGAVTLDLNAHTISGTTIKITSGTFIFCDSNDDPGTISNVGTYALDITGGDVTVENAEFVTTDYHTVHLRGGTLTVTGGYFYTSNPVSHCTINRDSGTLSVTGGRFNEYQYVIAALPNFYSIAREEYVYHDRTYSNKVNPPLNI